MQAIPSCFAVLLRQRSARSLHLSALLDAALIVMCQPPDAYDGVTSPGAQAGPMTYTLTKAADLVAHLSGR